MKYQPLHCHTYWSALDGLDSPAEYMKRCAEIGASAMSITDHGTNAGHREFLREAKAAGIKPILGQEGYITHDRFDRRSKAKRTDGTSVYNHITLLAQDQHGLENLNHYSNTAWNEGFYNKPRGDIDLLEECSEGLIVLSGCMSGMIPKAIEAGDLQKAHDLAIRFKDILGDRFYIEVMATNSLELNHQLLSIADELGIKPVMTSDCHYAHKEDLWVEEAMLILSANPKPNFKADIARSRKMDILDRYNYLYPDRTMSFQEIEVYMRDYQTERELFVKQGIERTDIFENTFEIADRIGEYEYYEGLDLLPKPKDQDPAVLLRKKAYAGLKKMGKDNDPRYTDRIEHELKVIGDKGFDPYFLVVGNTVRWAKAQGIRMSAGRGSGAGCLVNRTLGITNLDPIEHNLLFERFLDPSRPDWPDVDLDFQDTRRGEVKEYLKRQFKHVASIMTVTKLQGKSAIRDAARVFRVPLAEVNKALKDNEAPGDEDALDFFAESEQCRALFEKWPEVLELARRLEGRIKSIAMHPSGVVVSKEPIERYAPMETAKDPNDKDGPRIPMAAIDMYEAESLGLIKIDFLGLKTLSVIDDTINYIKERHGVEIDIDAVPMDDAGVYAELSKGHTSGVFQMEKRASTGLILEIGGISSLDELSVVNALVRPGAKKTIGKDYIARKKGQAMVQYVHPKMQPYTKDTYGLPTLYQEQVMQMCVELGGMTLTEANQLRRGLGKKKIEYILPFKEKFITNATELVGAKKAEKLWKDVEAGAGYGFNKSHSVAYSILGYQCVSGNTRIYDWDNNRYISVAKAYREGVDRIACYDENTGKTIPGKVRNVVRTTGAKNANLKREFIVETRSRKKIHCSKDHPILTDRGYKKVSDLSPGDLVAVERRTSIMSKSRREAISNSLKEYWEALPEEDKVKRMSNLNAGQTFEYRSNRAVQQWAAMEDEVKQNRTRALMESARPYSGFVVRRTGIVEGCGHRYSSSNEKFVCDWMNLHEIDHESQVWVGTGFADFKSKGVYIEYDGMSRPDSYFESKFGDEPFIVIRSREDVGDALHFLLEEELLRAGESIVFEPILSIEEGRDIVMYDIEMESDPHNFIANGVVVHNCAWLKYHYPVEFMASLLRNEKEKDTVTDYLIECKRMGIKVLLPHVNHSGLRTEPEGDNGVRLGLTNIKFIADKAANNIIAARPFANYAELQERAAVKGSGITSRIVGALNMVGAAKFPDNPLRGNERDNFYEYLKIPAFGHVDLEPVVKYKFRPLDEYTEKGVFPILGMVRGIHRGDGWARIDVVSEEASVGIFAAQDTPIEAGNMYAMLVADNRIVRYVTMEDLHTKVKGNDFVSYLYDEIPVPKEPDEFYTIAFRKYKTKAGKDMAYIVALDNLERLNHILCFSSNYAHARIVCRNGMRWRAKLNETEDGTLFVKDLLK